MKIPDKTSITLRKASEISMGAKKITNGWQFGIFSDDVVLSLTIFECGEPDGGMTIEIPQEFKCGRIFSFMMDFGNEEAAAGLDGACYAVGDGKQADIYAKEYCYAAKEQQDGDGFGRDRDELCSVLRSGQADIVENVYGEKSAFHAILDNPLIYKLHVRGFTKLAPGLGDTERGNLRGTGTKGGIYTEAWNEYGASYAVLRVPRGSADTFGQQEPLWHGLCRSRHRKGQLLGLHGRLLFCA